MRIIDFPIRATIASLAMAAIAASARAELVVVELQGRVTDGGVVDRYYDDRGIFHEDQLCGPGDFVPLMFAFDDDAGDGMPVFADLAIGPFLTGGLPGGWAEVVAFDSEPGRGSDVLMISGFGVVPPFDPRYVTPSDYGWIAFEDPTGRALGPGPRGNWGLGRFTSATFGVSGRSGFSGGVTLRSVPEPSGLALACLGGLACLPWASRRRAASADRQTAAEVG